MVSRACTYLMPNGRSCRATPMRDQPFCFWHAPETTEEAAEARRLGALHRRKKKDCRLDLRLPRAAHDRGPPGAAGDGGHRDAGLENSLSRSRVIAQIVAAGAKLIEAGDHEERLRALGAVRKARQSGADDAFPDERG